MQIPRTLMVPDEAMPQVQVLPVMWWSTIAMAVDGSQPHPTMVPLLQLTEHVVAGLQVLKADWSTVVSPVASPPSQRPAPPVMVVHGAPARVDSSMSVAVTLLSTLLELFM